MHEHDRIRPLSASKLKFRYRVNGCEVPHVHKKASEESPIITRSQSPIITRSQFLILKFTFPTDLSFRLLSWYLLQDAPLQRYWWKLPFAVSAICSWLFIVWLPLLPSCKAHVYYPKKMTIAIGIQVNAPDSSVGAANVVHLCGFFSSLLLPNTLLLLASETFLSCSILWLESSSSLSLLYPHYLLLLQ